MATGACPRSLWWLLMLQGLVGLLGPGAQALEEEGGGRGSGMGATRALPPHRPCTFQRSLSIHCPLLTSWTGAVGGGQAHSPCRRLPISVEAKGPASETTPPLGPVAPPPHPGQPAGAGEPPHLGAGTEHWGTNAPLPHTHTCKRHSQLPGTHCHSALLCLSPAEYLTPALARRQGGSARWLAVPAAWTDLPRHHRPQGKGPGGRSLRNPQPPGAGPVPRRPRLPSAPGSAGEERYSGEPKRGPVPDPCHLVGTLHLPSLEPHGRHPPTSPCSPQHLPSLTLSRQ